MQTLCFPSNQIFSYVLTGKFQAPSPKWKHEQFDLIDYELIVMTEGTLYLDYGQERYTVRPGEYLLLPPSDSLRQGFRPAYCSFYWLHFSTCQKELPQSLSVSRKKAVFSTEDFFTLPQTGTVPRPEKLVVLMKQLQDLVKNKYPDNAVNAMTTCILTELYGQLYLSSPISAATNAQKQIYLDIIDYIKTNISQDITVDGIAAQFGYSAKYISHRFNQISGVPLKRFILNQKIDAANFMLTDTNKTIAQIAQELGFSNGQNFTRIYKRISGLSPSEYRNAFKKRLLYYV
ncbi:MAG: AraC family transcriptional regulator [Eubacteriales bacterium]|nr:AraC family transcriptional regulator [Eubacteriales bacterium]